MKWGRTDDWRGVVLVTIAMAPGKSIWEYQLKKWGKDIVLEVMEMDWGESRYKMEDRCNNNNNNNPS